MQVKPLFELQENINILYEGKENKDLFLQGITVQAEIVNGNRRRYKREILESAVNKYVTEMLNDNRATGELNHPNENVSKINPDRISHVFTEVKQDENNFISKAKVLNTPCGKIVKNLVEGGVKIGLSSRGFGKTNIQNGVAIVESLYLVTLADIVVDPSGPDCWADSIYENKEWVFENGLLVEKNVEPIIDEAKRLLDSATPEQRNIGMVTVIKKLLNEYKIKYIN